MDKNKYKVTFSEEDLRTKEIFVTSDHHYYHENIIDFCDRPFNDVSEMNTEMTKRWNAIVSEDDIVFHLGDFAKGLKDAIYYLDKLNGKVLFLRGNHDKWTEGGGLNGRDNEIQSFDDFNVEIMDSVVEVTFKNNMFPFTRKIVLCHYPLRGWGGKSHYTGHLHGHCHGNLNTNDRMIDVGVDNFDFYPQKLSKLIHELEGMLT